MTDMTDKVETELTSAKIHPKDHMSISGPNGTPNITCKESILKSIAEFSQLFFFYSRASACKERQQSTIRKFW